jgi:predicted permease
MTSLPWWARALLRLTPAAHRGDNATDDLTELYAWRSRRDGRPAAGWRLFIDVLSLWVKVPRVGSMLADARFATRLLRRHRAATVIAIGGLAAAIAGATAVFSVINAAVLRPYGVADPSSLVSMSRPSHGSWPYWPYKDYLAARDAATLTSLEATVTEHVQVSLTAGNATAPRRWVAFCSGGFLRLLGVTPPMGRVLETADDHPAAPRAALVSHHYWRSQLSSAMDAIGRTIWLNGEPVTVVGVLPPDFSAPLSLQPSVFLALSGYDEVTLRPEFRPTATAEVQVHGRLHPGVSLAAGETELQTVLVARGIVRPRSAEQPFQPLHLFSAASPVSGADAAELYAGIAFTLPILGLVLLLACSNASNLLRATAAARTREIGIRLALGASARRVARQLLTESLVLSFVAAAGGWLVALWLSPVLALSLDIAPELAVAPDLRVLTFATLVAIACGIVSGLGPARLGMRGDVLSAVHARPFSDRAIWRTGRRHGAVVGFQAAVSMFLLAIAALLAHGTVRLQRIEPGFDADQLLAVEFSMPRTFDEQGYLDRAAEAIRKQPGVEALSVSQTFPFSSSREIYRKRIGSSPYSVFGIRSDADYFRTAGVSIIEGRGFTDAEVRAEVPVVIISRSFAGDFFAGRSPLGRSLSEAAFDDERFTAATIIGVAEDTITGFLESERYATIYRPLQRKRSNPPALLVRSKQPGLLERQVEIAVGGLDPKVAVRTDLPGEGITAFLRSRRVIASLASLTAGLALVLALAGLYGMTMLKVTERVQEAGIRLAIGATARDIVTMMARQALVPVGIGLMVGLLLATMAASTLLANELGPVSPLDTFSLSIAVFVLILPAALAVWIPARRAGRVDPLATIRES